MKNEYRNWNHERWEDEIKKAGSKKNLAAALGISTDTIRKWMNKAKPTVVSEVSEVLEVSKIVEEPIVEKPALEAPKKPKYPKEIQKFLDLLNGGNASMDELKAAAKDAEKWVLTPVSTNR